MQVLIADDHGLVLDTLGAFIEAAGDLIVVTAKTYDDAAEKVEAQGPFDLVLLDLNMPGMDGLSGLKRALALPGALRVALMTGDVSKALAEETIELGAAGFVPKTMPAKSLVNAIKFMAMGEKFVPADLVAEDDAAKPNPFAQNLTERETQVLRGLTEGKSNKEIARDLGLSEPTIKLHVKTLYRKIGAMNRTQAALMAKDAGLF